MCLCLCVCMRVLAEAMPVACHLKSVHPCFATLSGIHLQMEDLLVHLPGRNFKSEHGRATRINVVCKCACEEVTVIRVVMCAFPSTHVRITVVCLFPFCFSVWLQSMFPLNRELSCTRWGKLSQSQLAALEVLQLIL